MSVGTFAAQPLRGSMILVACIGNSFQAIAGVRPWVACGLVGLALRRLPSALVNYCIPWFQPLRIFLSELVGWHQNDEGQTSGVRHVHQWCDTHTLA